MTNYRDRVRSIEDKDGRKIERPFAPLARRNEQFDQGRHHILPLVVEIDEDITKGQSGTATVLDLDLSKPNPPRKVYVYASLASLKRGDTVIVWWPQQQRVRNKGHWVPIDTTSGGGVTAECACAIVDLVEKVWNKKAEKEDFAEVRKKCNCGSGEVACAACVDDKGPKAFELTISGVTPYYGPSGIPVSNADIDRIVAFVNGSHTIRHQADTNCSWGYPDPTGEFEVPGLDSDAPVWLRITARAGAQLPINGRMQYEIQVWSLSAGDAIGFAIYNDGPNPPAVGNAKCFHEGSTTVESNDFQPQFPLSGVKFNAATVEVAVDTGADEGAAYPPADGEPHLLVNEPDPTPPLLPIIRPRQTVTGTRSWVRQAWGDGLMSGTPQNFTLNTTLTRLEQYGDLSLSKGSLFADPATGSIICTSKATLRVSGFVVGDQGNTVKEQMIYLVLRVTQNIPFERDIQLWGYDVATDKTKRRFLHGQIVIPVTPGAQLNLYMNATADMGTFAFQWATFEAEELE